MILHKAEWDKKNGHSSLTTSKQAIIAVRLLLSFEVQDRYSLAPRRNFPYCSRAKRWSGVTCRFDGTITRMFLDRGLFKNPVSVFNALFNDPIAVIVSAWLVHHLKEPSSKVAVRKPVLCSEYFWNSALRKQMCREKIYLLIIACLINGFTGISTLLCLPLHPQTIEKETTN